MHFFDGLGLVGSFLNSIVHPSSRGNFFHFQAALIGSLVYADFTTGDLLNDHALAVSVKNFLHRFAWTYFISVIGRVSGSLGLPEPAKSRLTPDYAAEFQLNSFCGALGVWIVPPIINRLHAKGVNGSNPGNYLTPGAIQFSG
jgi:hypothetical protein